MEIHELGNVSVEDRARWPFAVAVDGEAVRFVSMESADFYASLFDHPVLFVAVDGKEWLFNATTPGWRQVTTFNLNRPTNKENPS